MVTISHEEKLPDGFQSVIIAIVIPPTNTTGRNSRRISMHVFWLPVCVASSAS